MFDMIHDDLLIVNFVADSVAMKDLKQLETSRWGSRSLSYGDFLESELTETPNDISHDICLTLFGDRWGFPSSGQRWGALGAIRVISNKMSDNFKKTSTFFGRSRIDPGVIWEHVLTFWEFVGIRTCHAGVGEEGLGPHVK